jgi:muramoyltetrapeptide carboxypeptidase
MRSRLASALAWPRPLQPGGTIGICSPAGPSPAEALQKAAQALEARGYRVIVAPNAAATAADLTYLAGSDDLRARDLNDLLCDPAVDMVLCARGGYGSAKILDRLDYTALRADPKPLVGYSDITALSLGIAARAGVVTFSGIMATAGNGLGEDSLDSWSEASLWQAVGNQPFPRIFRPPDESPPWEVRRGTKTVTGPVYPVCLSMLVSLLGTPYVPDLTGAVLVIEDVHEELYRIDRYLTQLRLAGTLDRLASLLIGSFNGMDAETNATLRTHVPLLAERMTPQNVAVASGVAYGHIARRLTLPVGAIATVDLEDGTFAFDKAGVG